jgi:hypothetical protein
MAKKARRPVKKGKKLRAGKLQKKISTLAVRPALRFSDDWAPTT